MTRRVLRWELPVDDRWHVLSLTGSIVHVATRHEDRVELWSVEDSEGKLLQHAFRVVGTGQPLAPALVTHVGSAVTPSGDYVWHVFEHE